MARSRFDRRLGEGDIVVDFRDFIIKIADMRVRMLCKFPYTQRLCADFISEGGAFELTVSTSDRDIAAERGQYNDAAFSPGYCEGICLYREIAEKIPQFDGFVFHGAAVEVCGRGVIFAARSGVGKSTHISLLLKNYPEDVKIINGDKPIIRRAGGEWRVFSTPWAGKEGWKTNSSAPLSAIVLLERSGENFIEDIEPCDSFDRIMSQVYLPRSGDGQLLTYDLIDDMARCVKFYRLGCNISDEAARVSFEMLSE